ELFYLTFRPHLAAAPLGPDTRKHPGKLEILYFGDFLECLCVHPRIAQFSRTDIRVPHRAIAQPRSRTWDRRVAHSALGRTIAGHTCLAHSTHGSHSQGQYRLHPVRLGTRAPTLE